jgi:ABC-type Na+ transport system ATPase subunit NatA
LEVVEKICSQLIILGKGQVIAYGGTSEVLQSIGQSTLEGTFLQLTEGRDVAQIAHDIVSVVVG